MKLIFASLLFFQFLFYQNIEKSSINSTLLQITGIRLSKYLLRSNIVQIAFWNLWYLIGLTIVLCIKNYEIKIVFTGLIEFNTLLFTAYLVGNKLNLSDLYSFKNRIWYYISTGFIFSVSTSLVYGCLFLLDSVTENVWIYILILLTSILCWFLYTSSVKRIYNFKYWIK
jgi:hypothetical protein